MALGDIIAGSTLQFAGGAFYFKVDKDAVLYFDNVRGVKTDSGETPKKTEDILHACDSVAGIAFAGVSDREVSTEHVTQGDYSVKGTVTTAGQDGGGYSTWLIYLKKDGKVPTIAELTAYDYIELSVYTESAGNIYVHNTIIQALTAGQNTVKLSTAKLIEVLKAWDGNDFNPYHESEGYIDFKIAVQLNTSVWVDNVRGVYPTE